MKDIVLHVIRIVFYLRLRKKGQKRVIWTFPLFPGKVMIFPHINYVKSG